MNPFLIEPYNAYLKPPKKKHWMEVAEEEALQHRMLVEEQLREAMILEQAIHEQALLQQQNLALKSQTPQPSSQQVQDGQYAVNAGGGGIPPVEFFFSQSENVEAAAFSLTPSSGIGPLLVTFTNLSVTPLNDTFYWDFGSGSLTSTNVNPAAVNYIDTGSYTVTLQETSSTNVKSSVSNTITVLAPTLISAFTVTTSSTADANYYFTASFTGSVSYNGHGTLSGLWTFGDATTKAYTNNNAFTHSYATGSYTASLAVTESSYKITATSSKVTFIK